MGLLSGVLGGAVNIGKALEKPFRTGASSAAKNAVAGAQETAGQFNEFIDMVRPGFELGQSTLQGFSDIANPAGLNSLYTDIQGSELADSMIADRTKAVNQAMAEAGLRRSGARLDAAAEIPTDVMSAIMNQILNMRQNVASMGLGQGSSILQGIGGIQSANNQATQASMAQANNKANILGGLIQGGSSIMAALSDERFKKNIEVVGTIGDLDVIDWEWIDQVPEELQSVMTRGFGASQVLEKYPQHVYPVVIEGVEILTLDYPGIMREVAYVQ